MDVPACRVHYDPPVVVEFPADELCELASVAQQPIASSAATFRVEDSTAKSVLHDLEQTRSSPAPIHARRAGDCPSPSTRLGNCRNMSTPGLTRFTGRPHRSRMSFDHRRVFSDGVLA